MYVIINMVRVYCQRKFRIVRLNYVADKTAEIEIYDTKFCVK
jgi:hypothetical protein